MPFVIPEMVSDNLGRPLAATEQRQAELWIGWAEKAIESRMGALHNLDRTTLEMVVTEVVTARLRSPEPVTQVDIQVDDASVSKRYQRSSGLIEILPEWWAALGWRDTAGGAFTIAPSYEA